MNIPNLYHNERGSNGYKARRRVLGLKHKQWKSVIPTIALIAVTCVIGYWAQKEQTYKPYMPVQVFAAKALLTDIKPMTRKQIIFAHKHGDIIWRIFGLETSFGRQPFLGCTKKGMVNDFGFGVTNNPPICFKDFNAEVNAVDAWIENHKALALGQMLCEYNQGTTDTNCDYTNNFLSL